MPFLQRAVQETRQGFVRDRCALGEEGGRRPKSRRDTIADFSKVTHVNYAFAWNDEAGAIYLTDRYVFDGLGEHSFSGGAGDGPVKCSLPFWHP